MAYIVDVAQGIKSGSQLESAKVNITSTLKDLNTEMVSCKKFMKDLVNDKTANVQQVKELTERLIKRIRELERITVTQIDSKYKDQSDEAGVDVTHLDSVISVMEEDLKNLDQSQQNSESTVFVDVILGQIHEAEGRKILQQVGAHRKTSPSLVMRTDMEFFLKEVPSLGNFSEDSKAYKAKLKGDYVIKIKKDKKKCDGGGSCLLPDGTVVITDWENNRLKHIDASYRVTGHCGMPPEPYDVTCTTPEEVAVTLPKLKKVQFVSVRGSMSMTRSFSTSDTCRGICCSAGELFVSCGGCTQKGYEEGPGHVSVYSLNGTHLRSIQTGPSGQQLFSVPRHITASPDGTRIYVAQYIGGVVSLDRSGRRVGSYNDHSLKNIFGLCTLDNCSILVCGLDSYNVLQFDSDGRKPTELLKDSDCIHQPMSLCYDNSTSRLIVTLHSTDKILVFNILVA